MKIHFIAIGGSVMHQLAIALHQKGMQVSGSDDVIFDPARSNLEAVGLLPSEIGWQADRITTDIDAIILGMHAKPDNPELLKAQSLNIPIYSYPAYIYEQTKDKKRVVIGGSHGKTTITSMIMHTLRHFGMDFDYLVGAKLAGFEQSVRLTSDAPIVVIEGDEYLSSPIHRVPKFHYYKANIALLSGIAWDHINVFPTFKNYVSQFDTFVENLETNDILIYNEEDELVKQVAEKAISLKKAYETPNFFIENGTTYLDFQYSQIALQIFGRHNLLNLAGAKLVCEALGIAEEQFFEAIQHFKGAARRLELIGENETCSVYKDFAHAPSKVKATTEAMSLISSDRKLLACLELHTYSSLNKDFLPQYKGSLEAADEAIVFFNRHTFEIKKLPLLEKNEVAKYFSHSNLLVFTDNATLTAHLKGLNYEKTNLLMMSSGNFGGMNLNNMANFATGNKSV
ncbi:MAG: UDP-N-acetylmuramate--L-alanine ligase [Chitinophagales bacterium]